MRGDKDERQPEERRRGSTEPVGLGGEGEERPSEGRGALEDLAPDFDGQLGEEGEGAS